MNPHMAPVTQNKREGQHLQRNLQNSTRKTLQRQRQR